MAIYIELGLHFALCRMNARLKEIELNDDDSVKCFRLADGNTLEGDLYVSAMPGDSCKPIAIMNLLVCCYLGNGRYRAT